MKIFVYSLAILNAAVSLFIVVAIAYIVRQEKKNKPKLPRYHYEEKK
jgi:hypothetical protein